MKSEKQKLELQLDKLVSIYVRQIDPYCVICGSVKNLQAGHVFSRSKDSTRWDLLNVHTQCAICNLTHNSRKGIYYMWFKNKYGEGTFDQLKLKSNTPALFTTEQLEKEIEKFKQLIKTNDNP